MVKISGWEKFRKSVTGSYSEKLTYQIAAQKREELAAAKAVEQARLEKAAREKAIIEQQAKAAKKPTRVEKVKAEAKTMPKPAAKKPAAKKPAAAGKTASTTPKKATAKKPAPNKATYKANAVDGDGDGLVQDGTPFERPAPKKKSAPSTKKKK